MESTDADYVGLSGGLVSGSNNTDSDTESDDTSSLSDHEGASLVDLSTNVVQDYRSTVTHLTEVVDDLLNCDRNILKQENIQLTKDWLENATGSLASWSLDVDLEVLDSLQSLDTVLQSVIAKALSDMRASSSEILTLLKDKKDFDPPRTMGQAIQTLQSLTRTIQSQTAMRHEKGPLQPLNVLIEDLAQGHRAILGQSSAVHVSSNIKKSRLDGLDGIRIKAVQSIGTQPPASRFRYLPLENRQIRLLHLQQYDLAENLLVGTISHFHLEEAPAFHALSICRTFSKETASISLNGVRLDVESNLHNALRTIFSGQTPVHIWVDMICVNTTDAIETRRQLALRYPIFLQAKQSHAWLGAAGSDDERAIDILVDSTTDGIDKTAARRSLYGGLQSPRARTEYDEFHKQDTKRVFRTPTIIVSQHVDYLEDQSQGQGSPLDPLLPQTARTVLAVVDRLLCQRWFSSLWVVQDVVASRRLIAHYGSRYISWDDLEASLSQLVEECELASIRSDRKFEATVRRIAPFVVSTTYIRSKFRQRDDFKYSLQYLVTALRRMRCSYPINHILLLVSVASDATFVLGPSGTPKIQFPSQTQQEVRTSFDSADFFTIDVYQGFMQHVIQRSHPDQALDIICRRWLDLDQPVSSVRRSNVILSTWMGIQHTYESSSLVGVFGARDKVYSACGSRALQLKNLRFEKRKGRWLLFVQGFILDRFDGIKFDLLNRIEPDFEYKDTPEDQTYVSIRRLSHRESHLVSTIDICSIIVAGRDLRGAPMPAHYPKILYKALEQGWQFNNLGENFPDSGTDSRSSSSAQFFRRLKQVCEKRALVMTAHGRLCLVPESTRNDDCICILYGCSTPVVLRPHRDLDETITKGMLGRQLLIAIRHVEWLRFKQLRTRMRQRKVDTTRDFINLIITFSLVRLFYAVTRWLSGLLPLGCGPPWFVTAEVELTLLMILVILLDKLWSWSTGDISSFDELRSHLILLIARCQKLNMSVFLPTIVLSSITSMANRVSLEVMEPAYDTVSLSLLIAMILKPCYHGIGVMDILLVCWWVVVYARNTSSEFGASIGPQSKPWVSEDTAQSRSSSLRIWYRSLFLEGKWDQGKLHFVFGNRNTPLLRWRDRSVRLSKPVESFISPWAGQQQDFVWEVVGACYLDGMMEGAAIDWQQEHHIGAQTFVLR